MKTRPYIGISMRLSRHRTFKNTFIHGIPQDYVNAVAAAGAIPVLLPVLERGPLLQEMLAMVDGIIISGSDCYISPSLWGEEPDPRALQLCPQSRIETDFDLSLLRHSWSKGLPLLGICQGHELINIALGGSLKGSVMAGEWLQRTSAAKPKPSSTLEPGSSSARRSFILHDLRSPRQKQGKERQAPQQEMHAKSLKGQRLAHWISVQSHSLLAEILLQGCPLTNTTRTSTTRTSTTRQISSRPCGKTATPAPQSSALSDMANGCDLRLQVNSFHGLAIDRLGDGLSVSALADDGTIEAIEWRADLCQRYPFLMGVQWHPEMLVCGREQAPSLESRDIPMRSIFTRLVQEAEIFRCSSESQRRKICFHAAESEIHFLPHWRRPV